MRVLFQFVVNLGQEDGSLGLLETVTVFNTKILDLYIRTSVVIVN